MVTGAIAPASVNGVNTTGWPWRASSMAPSSIGASYTSGELALTTVWMDGSRSSVSWSMPRAMRAISMASLTRVRPSE